MGNTGRCLKTLKSQGNSQIKLKGISTTVSLLLNFLLSLWKEKKEKAGHFHYEVIIFCLTVIGKYLKIVSD